MVNRYISSLIFVAAAIEALFGIAFILRLDFALDMWPMDGTTRLSFLFLASMFIAGATSQLWCLWRGERALFIGVGLNYMTIATPIGIYLVAVGASRGDSDLLTLGCVFLVSALFGAGIFLWSRGSSVRSPQPAPAIALLAFVVFVLALIVAGGAMTFHLIDVMPWPLTGDNEVVYGLMFLGASAYFAYSLLRPSWQNSAGQLAGFLAYDLVLIWPFIRHFSNVPDTLRLNLILYTAVVAISGLLAVYFLFVDPRTRAWRPGARVGAPVSTGA